MAKKNFKACLCVFTTSKKLPSKPVAFLQLATNGIKEPIPLIFTVEATVPQWQGYFTNRYLYEQQQTLAVVLTTKAKRYLQSIGYGSKTEKYM